jgi:hypothetical protein
MDGSLLTQNRQREFKQGALGHICRHPKPSSMSSIIERLIEVLQNSEEEEVAIDWRCPEKEWTTVGEGLLKGTKQARGLGY